MNISHPTVTREISKFQKLKVHAVIKSHLELRALKAICHRKTRRRSVSAQSGDNERKPSNKEDGGERVSPKNEEDDEIALLKSKKNDTRLNLAESYAKVCMFNKSAAVGLFYKCNYTVTIRLGLNESRILPVYCISDIGTGSSLMHKKLFKLD